MLSTGLHCSLKCLVQIFGRLRLSYFKCHNSSCSEIAVHSETKQLLRLCTEHMGPSNTMVLIDRILAQA